MAGEDKRTSCKYGADCYQKNPAHHAKYKHPVSPNNQPCKRQKIDTQDNPTNSETEDCTATVDQITNTKNADDTRNKEFLTLEEKKRFIKEKFLVLMPEDFYIFWEFCQELCPQQPRHAFKSVGLTLVGPYDVLSESFKEVKMTDEKYLLHWRYYYDPPEFQTIIKGDDKTGFHIGYFRDSPDELPVFVAKNNANENCTIIQMGENIFAAIHGFLEKLKRQADPFKKMNIEKLYKKVCTKAKDLNLDLSKSSLSMQKRNKKTVCKTLHTAGIVVPFDRRTQAGYRPLPVDDKELKNILNKVVQEVSAKGNAAYAPLQPILTAATIANDECDFGTGLELGINIFCYGHECFDATALRLLSITYDLLKRFAFVKITKAHLASREKGTPFVINFE